MKRQMCDSFLSSLPVLCTAEVLPWNFTMLPIIWSSFTVKMSDVLSQDKLINKWNKTNIMVLDVLF